MLRITLTAENPWVIWPMGYASYEVEYLRTLHAINLPSMYRMKRTFYIRVNLIPFTSLEVRAVRYYDQTERPAGVDATEKMP